MRRGQAVRRGAHVDNHEDGQKQDDREPARERVGARNELTCILLSHSPIPGEARPEVPPPAFEPFRRRGRLRSMTIGGQG